MIAVLVTVVLVLALTWFVGSVMGVRAAYRDAVAAGFRLSFDHWVAAGYPAGAYRGGTWLYGPNDLPPKRRQSFNEALRERFDEMDRARAAGNPFHDDPLAGALMAEAQRRGHGFIDTPAEFIRVNVPYPPPRDELEAMAREQGSQDPRAAYVVGPGGHVVPGLVQR